MAILDILKKKPAKTPSEQPAEKTEKKKAAEKPIGLAKPKIKRFGPASPVLKSPHVTEKAGDLAENNQYVFRVFSSANKTEIKKAVQGYYEVEVVSVKIINLPAKKKRLGKIQGTKPGYKKAIVKIKKGQKIELLPR